MQRSRLTRNVAVPDNVPISSSLVNPIVPASLLGTGASKQRNPSAVSHTLIGKGPERNVLTSFEHALPNPAFAPRPVPGSIIDLDVILQKCDFSTNKVCTARQRTGSFVFLADTHPQYVRDCLELLRIGGNLDNGKRVRNPNYLSQFRQMYTEDNFTPAHTTWTPLPPATEQRDDDLSRAPLSLSPPIPVTRAFDQLEDPCDPNHPRIFHMFWAGPFTDKPYMAVMSFLYTQNLGLDKPVELSSDTVGKTCRPQFWVWINPGPAAAVPNPNAKKEMYESLATNPWSAPFLDHRFREVVKFKMWNTTEQLDGIPELEPYWRDMSLFNSGGTVYKDKKQQQAAEEAKEKEAKEKEAQRNDDGEDAETTQAAATKKKGGLFEKVGSASESDYDRLSVVLSDMARFILTYRFGGIYLDADTLFLRDWEELWNYRGQFAYRWSWHQKYNTAILKLHKGSALSTFLFKAALENGLDFHPMTVSRYLKDAGLDRLLVRIPDALFDPAWLNMERYQRDRPPFPYFPEFSVLFSNDKFDTAGPEQVGYDGFFRGAYSYHFHNFWWLPFDPSRNWPDLGDRFAKGEITLREQYTAAAEASSLAAKASRAASGESKADEEAEQQEELDKTDLSWATVLKRTFEAYVRGEAPNMYGEWIRW